jgi:dolichyl-phosphate beta-glucosyltransferase
LTPLWDPEQPHPHLSVVIPAFNEAQRLPETLRSVLGYLEAQPYDSEVLVVDDGSRDQTPEIVRKWLAKRVPVRLAQHPGGVNLGKGAAVRAGMLAAGGRFRLFMDADNSTTVDQVERFWPWLDKGFDVVIGSRDVEGAVLPVRQPLYKVLAGDLGNMIIRMLVLPRIYDTQAGFKVLTARAALDIFPRLTIDRWGFDVEVLAVARWLGFRIKELPITWVNSPDSKVRSSAYLQVLREVWQVRRNLKSGIYNRQAP